MNLNNFSYLAINIFICIVPILFSFEKKILFYRNYKIFIPSILIISIAFIVVDSLAAFYGIWSFNSNYVIGIKLFSLPIEEILFFVTAQYSSIFIYEVLRYYYKQDKVEKKYFYLIIGLFFIILSLLLKEHLYTFFVIFTFGLLMVALFFDKKIFPNSFYFIFISIEMIPFLIVNSFLTALPIVKYNTNAILNIRFYTIPLEDFVYLLILVTSSILIYQKMKNIFDEK